MNDTTAADAASLASTQTQPTVVIATVSGASVASVMVGTGSASAASVGSTAIGTQVSCIPNNCKLQISGVACWGGRKRGVSARCSRQSCAPCCRLVNRGGECTLATHGYLELDEEASGDEKREPSPPQPTLRPPAPPSTQSAVLPAVPLRAHPPAPSIPPLARSTDVRTTTAPTSTSTTATALTTTDAAATTTAAQAVRLAELEAKLNSAYAAIQSLRETIRVLQLQPTVAQQQRDQQPRSADVLATQAVLALPDWSGGAQPDMGEQLRMGAARWMGQGAAAGHQLTTQAPVGQGVVEPPTITTTAPATGQGGSAATGVTCPDPSAPHPRQQQQQSQQQQGQEQQQQLQKVPQPLDKDPKTQSKQKLPAGYALVQDALQRTPSFSVAVTRMESALRAAGKWQEARLMAETIDLMRPTVERALGDGAYADRALGETVVKLQRMMLLADGKDATGITYDDYGDAGLASAEVIRRNVKEHADATKAQRELVQATVSASSSAHTNQLQQQPQQPQQPQQQLQPNINTVPQLPWWMMQPPPWYQQQQSQRPYRKFPGGKGRKPKTAAAGGSGASQTTGTVEQTVLQQFPAGPAPPNGARRV
jgi:hypothetical protein